MTEEVKTVPELWIAELEAAGWTKYMSSVWKSPDGFFYRGPFQAWQIMKQKAGKAWRMEERVVLGFIALCELTVITVAGTIVFFVGRYLWRLI